MACEYEIGLTAATMYPLSWYGLPEPIMSDFLPFSVRRKCGDAQYKGYGFPRASWNWSRLEHHTLWNLLGLFDNDDDASRSVYVQTYKDNEGLELATFLAVMVRPIDGNGKQVFPRSVRNNTVNYTSITLTLEHLEEQ